MATKSNIRSMRFSDTMIEMIESQVGDTFTAKFEALVTRCMWELPAKEKELERIKREIEREGRRLRDLSTDIYNFRRVINNLNMKANQLENIVNESIRQLET